MWVVFVAIGMILATIVLPVGMEIWSERKNEKKDPSRKALSPVKKEERSGEECETLLYVEDKPFYLPKTGNYPKADDSVNMIIESIESVVVDEERAHKAFGLISKVLLTKSLWLIIRLDVLMSDEDACRLRTKITDWGGRIAILRDVKSILLDNGYTSLIYMKLNWEDLPRMAYVFNWEHVNHFMVLDDWNPALFTYSDAVRAAQYFTYKFCIRPNHVTGEIRTEAFKSDYRFDEAKQKRFARAFLACFKEKT